MAQKLGDAWWIISMTVELDLPQDASYAEHLSFLVLVENLPSHSGKSWKVWAWFSGVLAQDGKHRTAGLWKQIRQIVATKSISLEVCKTKAHRSMKEAIEQGDVLQFLGNEVVETWAKEGATRGLADEGTINDTLACYKKVSSMLAGMVKLHLVYEARVPATKLEKLPDRNRVPSHKHGFEWEDSCQRWICKGCCKARRTNPYRHKIGICPGSP